MLKIIRPLVGGQTIFVPLVDAYCDEAHLGILRKCFE